VSEFQADAPQATASEGPYVAAKAVFEPATLRKKYAESTNAPPRPANILLQIYDDGRVEHPAEWHNFTAF